MALLLTLLTFGCYKQKAVTHDFGYGTIDLPKDYRFDSRKTERDPDSVRFTFTRVNDTHMNGQTSYAEYLVVSHLAPDLSEADFRAHLNRGRYDALTTRQPYSTETDGATEFQISSTLYERHPVTEPAMVIRLVDFPRRRVIAWYGYTKRYNLAKAKDYLRQIQTSLHWTVDLDSRFPDYRKWQGNDWMDAYFENQKLLGPALDTLGLETPFQQFIGDVSSWQSKGNYHVAIDGERPATLHLVEVTDGQPCSALTDISPDLRLAFRQIFPKQKIPPCFKVHKLGFWQKFPGQGNAIRDWIQSRIQKN